MLLLLRVEVGFRRVPETGGLKKHVLRRRRARGEGRKNDSAFPKKKEVLLEALLMMIAVR